MGPFVSTGMHSTLLLVKREQQLSSETTELLVTLFLDHVLFYIFVYRREKLFLHVRLPSF